MAPIEIDSKHCAVSQNRPKTGEKITNYYKKHKKSVSNQSKETKIKTTLFLKKCCFLKIAIPEPVKTGSKITIKNKPGISEKT